jgi:purine nucleosidase
MLALMGREDSVPVLEGAPGKLTSASVPHQSAGTQAIIDEAMRTDSKLPLYVAVGGGLTEVASALMLEPRIAERMTLVWIGGEPIPGMGGSEYNFGIDPLAAQHVFNASTVPLWQVSSGVYRTCMVSNTELEARVAPCGVIGKWLYDKLLAAVELLGTLGMNAGETWTLGDSPLVLLTALNDWVPHVEGRRLVGYDKTGSSQYKEVPCPRVADDGTYSPHPNGRTIRAYQSVDTRLMFEDFYAKLSLNFRTPA